MAGRIAVLLALPTLAASYCIPGHACWPSNSEWQALGESLSQPNLLWSLSVSSYGTCLAVSSTDPFQLVRTAHGACMVDPNCRWEGCSPDLGVYALPAYSVEVRTQSDIQTTIRFANTHNISVSIKATGHSYSGSSTMRGSLLIWMKHYTTYGTIGAHTDSCGTTTQHVLKIGGGQNWGDAYAAVHAYGGREIVGGGTMTVSAAGGWLMGGGLSMLSRDLGLGIDNVLGFDVVLANTGAVRADACSQPHLYWALRGGGGGSFAVVTAAYHRTHALTPVIVEVIMHIELFGTLGCGNRIECLYNPALRGIYRSFISFWVDWSPHLDQRWGGHWSLSGFHLYFRGSRADADATFLNHAQGLWAWRCGGGAQPNQTTPSALRLACSGLCVRQGRAGYNQPHPR